MVMLARGVILINGSKTLGDISDLHEITPSFGRLAQIR